MAGNLFVDEKVISSSKLWSFQESLSLKFTQLECSAFKFQSQLSSELLDHSMVNYNFTKKKGEPVEREVVQEEGFNGFCLRAHIVPTSGTTANLWIVIYPVSVEELLAEYALSKNPKWPGILLSKSEIKLGPVYNAILDDPCGTPILPAIIAGSPLNRVAVVPPTKELLARQASLMRTATIPETKSSRSAMLERWEAIQEDGDRQFKRISVDPIWPELLADQSEPGNKNFVCLCFVCVC